MVILHKRSMTVYTYGHCGPGRCHTRAKISFHLWVEPGNEVSVPSESVTVTAGLRRKFLLCSWKVKFIVGAYVQVTYGPLSVYSYMYTFIHSNVM